MPARPGTASDRHDRILDATYACAETYGLGRFTIEDVARRAGVSRQTIYEYFASKEALISALLQRSADEIAVDMERTVAAARDPERGLHRAVKGALERIRREPPFTAAERLDEALPYLTSRGGVVVTTARARVARHLVARHGIDDDTALYVGDMVVRMLISHAIAPDTERSLDATCRGIAHLVAAAVAAAPARPPQPSERPGQELAR